MPLQQRYQHGLAKFGLRSGLGRWLMVHSRQLFGPQASAPESAAGGVVDENSHCSATRVI